MSDHEAPHIEVHENNNPDLLSQQSGTPNMSSTKTFTVDTNMRVNGDLDVTGTVTATSFIGDGSQLTGIVGDGVGLDSAGVTLLVDSDYVQARETPQDFAYSSLTGAPTALSSFTNDTNYITAADIPATVDSDYVAARAPAAAGGLDSAGVQSLIDADLIGSGINSVAIGEGASTPSADNTVAVGINAEAAADYAVSIGDNATVSHPAVIGIAIGRNTSVTTPGGVGGVAIGSGASVSDNDTLAIGRNTVASAADATAIGPNTTASGLRSIAIGNNVAAITDDAVTIGSSVAGRVTYDTTNDWTFGATVNAPAFVGDGSGLTGLPAGGGLEGFDVSQYDSATSNGIFEYNVSPGNQLRHLYSLNDAVSPTAYDGSLEHQVSWTISSNQQFGFRDAGGFRTKVNALANGSTATTGLVLEGETFNNSGVELVGNVKLSSLPTSDPSETGLLWNDGGIPVFSGSTAPTGGGGLDSAATIALIGMQNKPAGDNAIQITPDTSTLNGDNNNIIIGTQISDMAGIGPQSIAMGYDVGAQSNGVSIGYQAGAGSQSTNSGGIFIGWRTNYFGNSNPADYAIAIGHEAGAVYPGVGSVALGKSAGAGSSGDYTVAIGHNANNTSSFNNTIMIKADGSSAYNSTAQYDIDIRTSAAGSLTYNTTNDWTFGAGVTMTDLVASGATVVFNNLPTVDPVNAGQLWNDAGTMKISAG